MTWKSHNHLRLLLSSAAMISFVVTIGCDALASAYTQYCPTQAYVAGQYVCLNFAEDFQTNCKAASQQSWVITVSPGGSPGCNGVAGHAFNVVTAPSCDLASGLQRYCAVEPQNGNSWCWTQNAGNPSIPSWVMQSVLAGLNGGGAIYACYGGGHYSITTSGGGILGGI
jgi:hypothetical protein